MADSLESWKQEGRYLPEFMRDFHDQKELFKFLDEVRARSDAKEGSMRSIEAVTWSAAHIYTVDIFLWVMAGHGYTLQRARKPFAFASITEAVGRATQRYRDQSMKALRSIFSPIAVVALLIAPAAHASDLRVPAGMLLCPTLADAMAPTHAGCWFARGGQRVEHINPMPTVSQILIRTTDGSETMVVYGLRSDADRLQRGPN